MEKNIEYAEEENKKQKRNMIATTVYVWCACLFVVSLVFGLAFPDDLSQFPEEKQKNLRSIVIFFKCLSYVTLASSAMVPFPFHGYISPDVYRVVYFLLASIILLCVYITNQYFAVPLSLYFLYKVFETF